MAISKIGSNSVDTLSSKLTLTAADGVEDNDYIMELTNAEATDGRSYGLRVKAGSTSADQSFVVQDHDASNTLLKVTGDGDVNVGIGDILFGTAGKGINLGVTSNTASNTLDDYEEGSAHLDVEDNGGNEMSFFEQDGQYNILYYTKIGNTVFFTVRLYSNGVSGMTGSDFLRITNLPFTSAARASGRFTITASSDFALTNAIAVGGFINDNSTIAYFRKQDTDGTGSYLTVTESNTPRCDLAGWYHTA